MNKAKEETEKLMAQKREELVVLRDRLDSIGDNEAQKYLNTSLEIAKLSREVDLLEKFVTNMGWG